MRRRPNYLAGAGSLVWLFVVGLPLYVMLAATLRTRQDYAENGPVSLPDSFTLDNYTGAFDSGFGQYFLNTLVVTGCGRSRRRAAGPAAPRCRSRRP